MSTEQFTINRRPGFEFLGAITVTIECDPSALSGVKLGIAVRAAIKSGANLSWADLSWANLSGADLSRADLSWANLSGANLSWANLSRADLSGANLSGANLSWANLSRANLSRANLSWANLSRADLSWADLSGANLSGANLSGAKINDERVTRCFARIMRDDGYSFLAFTLEDGGVKIGAGCRWFTVAEFRAHVAASYPDTDKATETLWIIGAIEQRAADLGITTKAKRTRKTKEAA